MSLQKGKNSPLTINTVLSVIVAILVVVLIVVAVSSIGKEPNIGEKNVVENQITNDVTNEVEEPQNTIKNVTNTTNTTTDPVEENPDVATIGDQTYKSLQEAINSVEAIVPTPIPTISPRPTPTPIEPTTITLLRDITGTFIIGENKYIVINMDNHSITSAGDKAVFTINGDLELQNGKIIGKYAKQQYNGVKVNKSGKLVCNTMNFDFTLAELGWIITNDGMLTIQSSTLDYPKGTAVNNNGTIDEISGTSYISSNGNYIALYNVGVINKLIGGEIVSNSYALFNSGTIEEIRGTMKVTSRNSYGIYNSKDINTITDDVEISSGAEDTPTIYNNGGNIKKIAGNVKINSEHSRALYNMGIITEISGNVSINTNGEYAVSTIYNSNPGELTILGGSVTHKNGGICVFREGGEVTIAGGNIASKYNC